MRHITGPGFIGDGRTCLGLTLHCLGIAVALVGRGESVAAGQPVERDGKPVVVGVAESFAVDAHEG